MSDKEGEETANRDDEPLASRSDNNSGQSRGTDSSNETKRTLSGTARPISSEDSCSLMPIVTRAMERSVRWKGQLIKEDDEAPSERSWRSDGGNIRELQEGVTVLQQKLREEVSRALLDDGVVTLRGDVVDELRRSNAALRRQLEHLQRLNRTSSAAERLQEAQAEIRELQDKVGKLQDEVGERRAAHVRELQRRYLELRRAVQQSDASRTAVRRLRAENAALRARTEQAEQAEREERRNGGGGGGVLPSASEERAVVGAVDLKMKLEKARTRLSRTERQLEEKRRHPKRVAHSVESLETLRFVWSDHITLLEKLQQREAKWRLLRDRVNMYERNMEILRAENEGLSAQMDDVHGQLRAFVDNPVMPTALVERNVALLKHMEKIEATLAEKAVELDEQEDALKLEQNKVRDLLVKLEGLRRENRHLNRRLQKAEIAEEGQTSPPDSPDHLKPNTAERRTPLGIQNLSMYLIPMPEKEPSDGAPDDDALEEGDEEDPDDFPDDVTDDVPDDDDDGPDFFPEFAPGYLQVDIPDDVSDDVPIEVPDNVQDVTALTRSAEGRGRTESNERVRRDDEEG